MFGVIPDMTACPQCGMPAVLNDYHVSGEEEVACSYCGYQHQKTLSGKKIQKGYGCIHYVRKSEQEGDDAETIVRLKTPLSLLGRHNIILDIQQNYDMEKSAFYVWDENKNELEAIVGAKPMTLEKWLEEQHREEEYRIRSITACCSDDFL